MENTKSNGAPRFLWVVIILLLAGMYSYAAYYDPARPDNTVKKFYQAYYNKDYNTVASNLSVFWAVRLLPQYAAMSPAELLENRPKIEADISKVIANIEGNNPSPKNIKIEVLRPYTKIGLNSAIVVYQFKEKDKVQGMEAAILINEKGRFRIFTMTPVDTQGLEQVKAVNIKELDANLQQLLEAKE